MQEKSGNEFGDYVRHLGQMLKDAMRKCSEMITVQHNYVLIVVRDEGRGMNARLASDMDDPETLIMWLEDAVSRIRLEITPPAGHS